MPASITEDYLALEKEYVGQSLSILPVVLDRAQNAHVWDVEGNRYIDFMSCFSVVNQGHCNPRLTKAMIEQCQRLTLSSRAYCNRHYPLLCEKLCKLLGFEMGFAMNSGSEIVDMTVKIARKWGYKVKAIPPDQALVVTVTQNFHGRTMAPLAGSNDEANKSGR